MAFGDIPFRLHQDGECTYHDCTSEGHEVCKPVWEWLKEIGRALEAGDLEKAREIYGRMK